MDQKIMLAAEDYVRDLFEQQNTRGMHFHNIAHTEKVVQAAKILADKCFLTENEKHIVLIAAWFHDTGYFFDRQAHEKQSIAVATEFLKKTGAANEDIELVSQCIEATEKKALPETKLQKVIKDADLYHLSTDEFFEQSLSLRKEWKAVNEEKMSKEEFLFDTFAFMHAHHYFTQYGRTILARRKEKNIEKLKDEIHALIARKSAKKLEKKGDTSRGIETMFRATARNQINLSAIADNKSNILITVNAIILSVMITFIFRDIHSISNILFPLISMVVTNLLTIIFAVMATLPHLSPGKFHERDVKDKRANLLFFGNFHKMDYQTYEWGIKEMMNNYDYLYGTMIRDQYELGLILNMKFKKLRIAYFIFMFGLIGTFLLFLIFSL